MQAAEELVEEGISVEVVDPRTLVPLDKDIIINSVKKTGKVVLVNDAHKTSGFIGEISAIISESEAFDYLDAPIRRCAGEDVPMPYAQNLENAMIPTIESTKPFFSLYLRILFTAFSKRSSNVISTFTSPTPLFAT